MSEAAPLVLLCAGGTGGHMMPARAVADELLSRGCRVALVCDTRGRKFFDDMVGVDIYVLNIGRTSSTLFGKIKFIASLILTYFQSHKLLYKIKPDVAVGFGGYPSSPPLFAAQHQGVRTILHEQNAILGLANILLAPGAWRIALSHKDTIIKEKWKLKAVHTGNPVRKEIVALAERPYPPLTGKLNLLIFGGSLGAKIFSDVVPQAIKLLPSHIKERLIVSQQAREDDLPKVRQAYESEVFPVDLRSFFNDMPEQLARAHLLICRSGGTVTETTIAGRPAIYVPYPWHKDQQQLHNARQVVNVGGGWLMEERDLTSDSLHSLLLKILTSDELLPMTAACAKALGKPDAAHALADLVMQA